MASAKKYESGALALPTILVIKTFIESEHLEIDLKFSVVPKITIE